MKKSVAFLLFTALKARAPENKARDIDGRVDNYRPVRRTGGRAGAAVLGLLFIALAMLLPAGRAAAQSEPPEIVGTGDYHTCGLKPDGSVQCWGWNSHGQAENQTGPFTQISVGDFHTCGLEPEGSVQCWGYDFDGQAESQTGPFTQVSARNSHTCGLKPDGSVQCWGSDDDGQSAGQTGPFTQVSTGYAHTCGLEPDGSVQCWGLNSSGQATNQTGPFTQVSTGGWYTCGLKPDGSVECWGSNVFGQAASQTGPFTQVSAGNWHTCGLRPDGSVECWGDNEYGEGDSQTGPFVQISAGAYHTCGLKPDGSVECWGDNDDGQSASQTGPFGHYVPSSGITVIKQVDGGATSWSFDFTGDLGAFSLSDAADSHVADDLDSGTYTITETAAEGYSTSVSCDSGESGTSSVDVEFSEGENVTCTFTNTALGGITVIKQVIGGDTPWSFDFTGDLGAFSLSHTADNHTVNDLDADTYTITETFAPGYSTSVSCNSGESGTSSVDVEFSEGENVTCTFTNIALGGITTVKHFGTGFWHTCGLKPDGSVQCWGNNDSGQAASQTGPFMQISVGGFHNCGLTLDGDIQCWGNNAYSQSDWKFGPFTQVSAGDFHTCGLRPDGSVLCWGLNGFGQAADQTGPFTQISIGAYHTCGLKQDGSVQCWGNNDEFQAESQTGPFIQVSAGGYHTCGHKPDGSVECWGDNDDDQAESQAGPFTQVSAGSNYTCGVEPDGSVECWGLNDFGEAESQTGPFTQVSAGGVHTCGLKPGGSIECWGYNDDDGQADSQTGPFGPYVPPTTITVSKRVVPNDIAYWSFAFTGDLGAFSLSNEDYESNVQTFADLDADTYTITETAVAGYSTEVSCDSGESGTNSVEVVLGEGESVYCEFTNTVLSGITVVKEVVGGNTPWSFDFTGDLGAFSLSDTADSHVADDLDSDTYTITETAVEGYSTVVNCDNGDSGTNSVDVVFSEGENITCTFTNTADPGPEPGSITIVKHVVGGDTPWSFDFTGDLGAFSLTDAADSHVVDDLDADTYSITETAAPGYSTAVSCDNGDSGTSSVDVVLEAGEDVICTFTNTADPGPEPGSITIVKHVVGGDTPWSFDFTGDLGAFSLTDAADSHVADDLDADTYSITETAAPGYSTAVSCDNGDSGTSSVDVVLEAGEDVICTFTNTYSGVVYVTAAGGKADNDVEPDVAYLKGDILKWDGVLWTKWFSGAAQGLKTSADLTAFDVDETVEGAVWLSWLKKLTNIPGVGTAAPQDIVYFDGAAFQLFLDGSDVQLTTAGEGIDGVEVLPGGMAQGFPVACTHYLLITTHAGGKVRNGSEPVIKFTGEDVLGFCMTSAGSTTAGYWKMAVDLGSEGLKPNNSVDLSVSADGNTLYFLPKKKFTLDGATVKPSEVAAFDRTTGTFSGPVWKAKNYGLKQVVDGFDWVVVP